MQDKRWGVLWSLCPGRGWLGILVLVTVSAIFAIAIRRMASDRAPVRDGTVEEFQEALCPSEWPTNTIGGLSVFGKHENRYIYELRHFHGSILYSVPEEDIHAQLEEILERIRAAIRRGAVRPSLIVGFLRWEKKEAGQSRNFSALLDMIEEAHFDWIRRHYPGSVGMFRLDRQRTWQRLEDAKSYWTTQVFECCYFTWLTAMAVWGIFWTRNRVIRAMLLAVIPILFFLPLYLGYSVMTFSSHGPAGGILYPYLGSPFAMDMNAWDRALVKALPAVLEPLSSPTGSPLSLSWRGFPSITRVAAVGILFGALYCFGPGCWRALRKLAQI